MGDIVIASVGPVVSVTTGNATVQATNMDILDGDILLIPVAQWDTVASTIAAGWTIKGALNGSTFCRGWVAWKRASGAQGSVLITHSAGNDVLARMLAVRGCVSSGDPFVDYDQQANTAAGTQMSFPDSNTAARGMMFIHGAGGCGDTSTVYHMGAPTGAEGVGRIVDDYSAGLGTGMIANFLAYGYTNTGNSQGTRTCGYLDNTNNAPLTLTLNPTNVGTSFCLQKEPDPVSVGFTRSVGMKVRN